MRISLTESIKKRVNGVIKPVDNITQRLVGGFYGSFENFAHIASYVELWAFIR